MAADILDYVRLAPLTAQVDTPTIVTIGPDGRVYIAETSNNLVRIFSPSGSLIHSITGLSKPISLAVDAGGRIYIGNLGRGNVEVYDTSFAYLFKIGQGNEEFGQPNDIDIDASGLIYVVDKTNSAIKLYNPDGTYNSSLGQSGNNNGQFHHPVSLVIDTATNELVVLDLQQRRDTFNPDTMIDGARIQFLQLNGTFKRGYAKFGYHMDNGELVMPMHIAVDDQSRVYVSDSRMQKVMVYNNNGAFLSVIDNASKPLRTPMGMAMGKTNKLYIASLPAGQVEIYGIDSYINMAVSPASLCFEEIYGEASGNLKDIIITNTGNRPLTWTASSEDPWLILPGTQGISSEDGPTTVNVGVDIDNLEPGQYKGSVTITADGVVTETVTVTLTVQPNTRLSVSPPALTFVSTVGNTPAAQTLAIENTGGGTLNWNASGDQSWLILNAASGTAPSALKVSADITSLPAGSYSGTVTVTKHGFSPETTIIPVSMTVSEPPESPAPPVEPPPIVNPGGNSTHKNWTTTHILPGTSLNGIWGSSNKNVFVVGAEGSILRYNGKTWSEMVSGTSTIFYGIWGSSTENVYAVGENGLVLHFDGHNWSPVQGIVQDSLRDTWGSSASNVYSVGRNGSIIESFSSVADSGIALNGIWGNSESDIFVVGDNGTILHFDGRGWSPMISNTAQCLNGIWGSSRSDVFAVGEEGAIIHYDGTSWSSMDSATTAPLQSVWGSSGEDVFAVGANGLILYYNGTSWHPVTTTVKDNLNDVWVSDKSELFAVGENGTVVYGKAKFPLLNFIQPLILFNAAKQNMIKKTEEEQFSTDDK
ncbi:MAG: hypothetical protein KJ990_07720 [Proteobacteria bacterium]|nr:hypothetical protein [Pseudomonadota bacterium]MBU1650394.1 hypothetical protein [Pseudomonadota bacterium]MBU1985702.1 hypothetical protein [Pseudomonadota bacterium]